MTTSKKFVKSIIKNQMKPVKKTVPTYAKAVVTNLSMTDAELQKEFFDTEQDTLDLLTESIAYAYKEDTTRPGVLISKVNKGGRVYYASVLRFLNGSKERIVVVSATGSNKNEAVDKLAKAWVKLQKPKLNPIDELKIYLGV